MYFQPTKIQMLIQEKCIVNKCVIKVENMVAWSSMATKM